MLLLRPLSHANTSARMVQAAPRKLALLVHGGLNEMITEKEKLCGTQEELWY